MPLRDDCGEFSKMAPPTIANGRVYLASFGSENVGTGQFCVYGLLPAESQAKLAAPEGVKASVASGMVRLTWANVSGARVYRVLRKSTLEAGEKTVAMGLTKPYFTEPAPERGESTTYRIVAIGPNGVGDMSAALSVKSPKPKQMEP